MCRTLTKEPEIKEYIRKWAGEKSVLQMSVDLNVDQRRITTVAGRMGISVELNSIIERRKKVEELILNKGSELSAKEISEMVGLASVTVRNKAKAMNVELKQNKPRTNKPVKKQNSILSNYFNPERSNWLI